MEEMKDRITFQTTKLHEGPVKPLEPQYEDHVKVWAKVEYLKGREFWEAKANNAETTVRFIIRYRKDIDTNMIVKYNNSIYNIVAPPTPLDNTKRWLVVLAKEVITA
ncbi:phage head closure protein [uncultured Clostridium sp.]|uniref:phage head closure protein n=1 Tax=uncultured Clostridium sp. TaxID=59620 RepID=UPI0028E660DB|nr:phage head closure protein [uncultured Clostridium sp.]